MSEAIPVVYFWKGTALPSETISFSISVQCLKEKIADLKSKGAKISCVVPVSRYEEVVKVQVWRSAAGHEKLNLILANGNSVKIDDYYKWEGIA